MNAMVELLGEMRGRVPMYVGTNSVAKLASFLRGYQYALEKQGLGRDADFLSAFQELAQSRYGVKTSKAWEDILLFQSSDDHEAMERFCACMMTIVREASTETRRRTETLRLTVVRVRRSAAIPLRDWYVSSIATGNWNRDGPEL